jgi:membrane dipeptidase
MSESDAALVLGRNMMRVAQQVWGSPAASANAA